MSPLSPTQRAAYGLPKIAGTTKEDPKQGSGLPRIQVFDAGSENPGYFDPRAQHELVDLPAGTQVLSPTESAAVDTGMTLPASLRSSSPTEQAKAETALPSIQLNPDQQAIDQHRDMVADQADDAMRRNDVVDLGHAAIKNNMLDKAQAAPGFPTIRGEQAGVTPAPATTPTQPSSPASATAPKSGGFLPVMSVPKSDNTGQGYYDLNTKEAQREQQKEEQRGARANFERQRDYLRGQISNPTDANGNPILDRAKALEASGFAQEKLADLQKNNPWGSEANHPGKLGKLEHVLSTAGQVAGGALFPSIMAEIPGTSMN